MIIKIWWCNTSSSFLHHNDHTIIIIINKIHDHYHNHDTVSFLYQQLINHITVVMFCIKILNISQTFPGRMAPVSSAQNVATTGMCNAYLPGDSTLDRFLWVIQYYVGEQSEGNKMVILLPSCSELYRNACLRIFPLKIMRLKQSAMLQTTACPTRMLWNLER